MKGRYAWSLVLILVLLIVAFNMTGNTERTKRIQAFKEKKIFTASFESVTRIKITKKDKEPIEAVSDENNQWSIIKPYPFVPTHSVAWNNLSQVAANFINQRTIQTNPTDLEPYGLEDPILEVEITIENEDHLFQFGSPDPTRNNFYARKDGGEIFLMPAQLPQLFFRDLEELRDKRLMPLMADGINKITYQRFKIDDPVEDDPLTQPIRETYEADTDGVWRITKPVPMYAYQNKLKHIVEHLQRTEAVNHIDDPESLSDFDLDPPWSKMTAFNQETGESQTILFGGIDDYSDGAGVFATIEGIPIVFTVPVDMISKLPGRRADYREKRLMTKEATDLNSITYKDNRNEITLIQDLQKGWVLDSPTPQKMDNIAVSTFIAVLLRVQGETFPDSIPPDTFTNPKIELMLDYRDGAQDTIQIGGIVPDSDPIQFYAKQDFGEYTTIPLVAFKMLQSNPFRFKDKHLIQAQRRMVDEMHIYLDDIQFHFEKTGNKWELLEPAEIRMSSLGDAEDLLDIILGTQASGVVKPIPELETMGLVKPMAKLGLTVSSIGSGKKMYEIHIGNLMTPNSRDRFAKNVENGEYIYVRQDTLDDIHGILRSFRQK